MCGCASMDWILGEVCSVWVGGVWVCRCGWDTGRGV